MTSLFRNNVDVFTNAETIQTNGVNFVSQEHGIVCDVVRLAQLRIEHSS
jgi:hypothetical protein